MVKAQVKIQQMAFMIIAVTILLVVVGLFLISFRFSDINKKADLIREKEAIALVSKLANSPEFSCGDSYGTRRTNCVDALKVLALRNHIEDYEGFWGVKDIEIAIIYPERESLDCNLGNFPNCNRIDLNPEVKDGIYISNYITLCRKSLIGGENFNECDLAKLLVSYG